MTYASYARVVHGWSWTPGTGRLVVHLGTPDGAEGPSVVVLEEERRGVLKSGMTARLFSGKRSTELRVATADGRPVCTATVLEEVQHAA